MPCLIKLDISVCEKAETIRSKLKIYRQQQKIQKKRERKRKLSMRHYEKP